MKATNLMDELRFSGRIQHALSISNTFSRHRNMTLPSRTFAELFCERYHLSSESYAREMLRRALYPRARMFAPVMRIFWPTYFDADLDFVRGVGLIRRAQDLGGEVTDFHLHPRNRGFLRHTLKIRVSCQRMSGLVAEAMGPRGSSAPGAAGAPAQR
jgi:hypothetical protein